jgi:uncharacterized membrane protein
VTTLTTWTFDTPGGAERALRALARLPAGHPLVVPDAAVVSWPDGRRSPRAWQAGGTDALAGAFWGLLVGVVFLLPLAGPAAAATGAFGHVGLPDEFLRGIRDRVVPGTSALFLLTADDEVDRIAGALAETGAGLLASALDAAQEAALRRAFDDGEDIPAPAPVATPAG